MFWREHQMFDKRWAGILCAGIFMFPLGQVQAATKAEIHSKNLGRVAPRQLVSRLNLQTGSTLVAAHALRLDNGRKLTRMRQVYKGVPVYGRSVVVEHGPRGNVLSVDGTLERHLGRELVSVTPRLAPVQARVALQRARGELRQSVRNDQAKLYVYSRDKQSARLIYRVSYLVGTGNRISRPTAIIDANTGEVIRQWDGLTTGRRPRGSTPTSVQATGPGGNGFTGLYHYDGSGPGREKLGVTRQGNVCYMQNDDVATYNLAGGQRITLWSFGCSGSNPANWISAGDTINGGFSAINDAHHFGQVVHDMYERWFGQPPLKNDDGSPMQLHMLVHYGTNYRNAAWTGSQMIFGDGLPDFYYPFVSLDITGHEISHGFTEQHSGLEYTGQSGGMNEAFSDMAGQAVVYYDTGSNDFLIGSSILMPDVIEVLGLPALRDMCDPPRDGKSIDNAADYDSGTNVHYSSGIYNKAFCLLAKTGGWNTKKAFEVFHDANALYWGPEETFDSGACGVEQAATDRGYAKADVAAAFTAVGVTCSDDGDTSTSAASSSIRLGLTHL